MYKNIFDFSKLIGEIDILIFCNPAPLTCDSRRALVTRQFQKNRITTASKKSLV